MIQTNKNTINKPHTPLILFFGPSATLNLYLLQVLFMFQEAVTGYTLLDFCFYRSPITELSAQKWDDHVQLLQSAPQPLSPGLSVGTCDEDRDEDYVPGPGLCWLTGGPLPVFHKTAGAQKKQPGLRPRCGSQWCELVSAPVLLWGKTEMRTVPTLQDWYEGRTDCVKLPGMC